MNNLPNITASDAIAYLDCSPLMSDLLAGSGALADGIIVHRGDPTPAALRRLVQDARIVLNGHTAMDAELLAAAPNLKSIVYLGTGASSYVDMGEASARGIVVRVVRNYGDRTIAEHAFGLLLAAARDCARMDRDIRAGVWAAREGIELHGKTLGVVGTGPIGAEMVRIAAGFGMRVVAWNRSGVDPALPCEDLELDRLLAGADAVSIHLALTPETRGFFNAARIRRLKRGVLLVNVARGALFDEGALLAALADGHVGHAALDVFATEPLPAGHPFTTLQNVTLSAHAAWKSREASDRLLRAGLALARADAERLATGGALTA
ncbi:MAG: 3-phosphoglycerate dehydrogenase [Betaproteobacteria bacterium]|nr:3-phosphoglycerate dehydrogenase [Betaproteobacteria bacterium]